jgi:hypothetical protein
MISRPNLIRPRHALPWRHSLTLDDGMSTAE